MKKLIALAILTGCTPAAIQTTVHVTTYKDGQTDIVKHELLFRGKLGPNTVKEVLSQYHLAEDTTVVNGK